MQVTITHPIMGKPAGTVVTVADQQARTLIHQGYAFETGKTDPVDLSGNTFGSKLNEPQHAGKWVGTGSAKDATVGPASGDTAAKQRENASQQRELAKMKPIESPTSHQVENLQDPKKP